MTTSDADKRDPSETLTITTNADNRTPTIAIPGDRDSFLDDDIARP